MQRARVLAARAAAVHEAARAADAAKEAGIAIVAFKKGKHNFTVVNSQELHLLR